LATAGRSESGTSIQPTLLVPPHTLLVGFIDRNAVQIFWMGSVAACVWILGYIFFRSVQPYPLDAFEEYELHKVIRWQQGAPLYGSVETEVLPEAYPPLHFWLLRPLVSCFGTSFVPLRLLSMLAFAGTVAAGYWSFRDANDSWRNIARIAALTLFLSFHALVGKWFELGKPDMLLTMFLAWAVVAGGHRTWAEVLLSSVAIWLASLTKQNAPLFVLPLGAAHFLAGRKRWAIGWATAMSLLIGTSYWVLDRVWNGAFFHWVFVWTASHGIDWPNGLARTTNSVLQRGPLLIVVLTFSLVVRPKCRWTWCLAAAILVAVMGMAKSGGRENHLLPAAFIAACVAARWGTELGCQSARATGVLAWRPILIVIIAGTIVLGLPNARDYRWVGKRSRELADWTAAVSQIDGSVAVGHNFLLAHQAGAECFFSDLILEFPGLAVPPSVRARIETERFDYLILGADPKRSPTAGWSELIAEHYEPAGDLDFTNRSNVLPNALYQARRLGFNQATICSLSPVIRGEGRGEGFCSSALCGPLTLTLSPEYRGEGTGARARVACLRTRRIDLRLKEMAPCGVEL